MAESEKEQAKIWTNDKGEEDGIEKKREWGEKKGRGKEQAEGMERKKRNKNLVNSFRDEK